MIKLGMFNSNCLLCDSEVSGKVSLCDACRIDLPRVEFSCRTCALPLENNKSNFCGQCMSQKTYIDYAENLFHYLAPIDYLIGQMKFQQKLSSAAILADLLKEYVENNPLEHGFPNALLPVPLHNKRLARRGFNQSLEIIKPLAKSKQIPILLDVASRSKATQTQTHLNKQQRKKNVAACFTLLKKPMHSHIVIIDDVVTTGATTHELAKLLKKSGVEKVGVWSLARAELH